MQLIAQLEREKRGVYAGAVGYFGYGSVDGDKEIEGAMDVSGLCSSESYRWLWLMQADVHCATNDACQRRHRVSPSRGKFEVYLAFAIVLTIGQGGIVFDSDPYDEWMETINKLGESNVPNSQSPTTRRLTAFLSRREHALHHLS